MLQTSQDIVLYGVPSTIYIACIWMGAFCTNILKHEKIYTITGTYLKTNSNLSKLNHKIYLCLLLSKCVMLSLFPWYVFYISQLHILAVLITFSSMTQCYVEQNTVLCDIPFKTLWCMLRTSYFLWWYHRISYLSQFSALWIGVCNYTPRNDVSTIGPSLRIPDWTICPGSPLYRVYVSS